MGVGSAAKAHLLNIGFDVMAVVLDKVTHAIVAQIGDSTNAVVDSDRAEWWQHTGFASMPAAPTQGAASCQGIAIKHSDRDMVIASRDLRAASIYGNLKPGETCVYAATGAARTLYKANGSVVDYTTSDNTAGGTSISAALSPTGYSLVTPWGAITINSNGITLTAGQASLTLTPDGVATLAGTQVEVAGSVAAIQGTVGTFIGPKAVPTPATGAAMGPGAPLNLFSTNVFISP